MARVTVEDCIEIVPNRFELIILAAQRTRQIFSGAPLTIERANDKYPVVSLREIAEKTVDTKSLHEAVVTNYRKHLQLDESEQEMADMLLNEQEGVSTEIGANSFEEILTEEELAASFLADESESEEEIVEPDEDDMEEEIVEEE